jgi:hypothetical protein
MYVYALSFWERVDTNQNLYVDIQQPISTNGLCGPKNGDASCIETDMPCCNGETWKCGNMYALFLISYIEQCSNPPTGIRAFLEHASLAPA